MVNKIFAVRTTANREEQVMDFMESNIKKRNLEVYALVNGHGMRGYIFAEAETREAAEQACLGIPYSRGLLPKEVQYSEIEPMLEQIKAPLNIQEKDIVEIIQGPFKKEKAKVKRIDEAKEEVVVELLEAAIPIPITVKVDWVKVIRRESEDYSTDGSNSED
jgi:transcriptional antiterminator NusG